MLLWWGAKSIMKLVFDARVLKFQNTGLSRYTYCLLKAVLQNLNQVHSIIILINENLPDNEKDHICELIDISIISFKIIDIDPFSISQYFFLSSCNDLTFEIRMPSVISIYYLFLTSLKDFIFKTFVMTTSANGKVAYLIYIRFQLEL